MDATDSVSITGGGYSAQISLLGGQLLDLTHHDDELIVPAAKTEGAFAGAVLAPWPNRTKAGRYTFNGVEHLLPVNEEATGAALHGLLIDLPLHVVSQTDSEVQLAGWLESSEGYPFGLDIAMTYRVSADLGLAATLMARYRPEELTEDSPQGEEATQSERDDAVEPAEDLEVADPETADDVSSQETDTHQDEPDQDGADQPDTVPAEAASLEDEAAEGGGVAHEFAASASDDPSAEGSEAADPETTDSHAEDSEAAAPDAEVPEGSEAEDSEAAVPDAEVPEGSEAEALDAEGSEAEGSGATDTDPSPAPVPQTAPFGAGFHPYLTAGGASLRECRLRLPARTLLKTKADGTVTGRKTVAQDFDLTNAPLLSGRTIDHAFTDLPEEGWTAELIHGPSGFVVRMIADSPWVQVYTGERIDRAGVAVEPMTCPPNALNSGEDLIYLEPGKWFRMGYSIEAIRAA